MSVLPPRLRTARAPRAVLTGLLVCAVGSSVAVLAPASSASAATKVSTYALSAHGYSSQVDANLLDLRSTPTAYSVIGCTRRTGYTRTKNLVQAVTGGAKVDTARTVQHSYKNSAGTTVLTSTSTLASATLGDSVLGLRITGLRSIAKVTATKSGKMHASSVFTFADIKPVGLLTLPSGLDQPVDQILKSLAANGPLVIPGVGVIKLGAQGAGANSRAATAAGTGLQIHLYGADRVNRTSDDQDVTLVRTYARISGIAQHGLFSGAGWGLDASAVNDLVALGKTPYTPLGCEGTKGAVVTGSLAGLDLLSTNQVKVAGLRNRVYGKQNSPTGGLTGWTEDTIADIDLAGGVHIEGIRARAKAVRSKSGKVSRTSTQVIGSITLNGTKQTVPSPGHSLTIPGLLSIDVPKPVKTSNGIRVTALRITLLSGTAAQSVVDLGNATVSVRAH